MKVTTILRIVLIVWVIIAGIMLAIDMRKHKDNLELGSPRTVKNTIIGFLPISLICVGMGIALVCCAAIFASKLMKIRLAVDVPSSDTSVIYKLCEDGSVITVTPTGVRRHKLGNNRMKYEFSVKIKRDMGMMKTCIKFNNRVHHPRVTMHLFVIGAALLCMLAAVVEMAIGDKAYSGQKNIEAAAHKLNETYFFI